MSYTDEEISRAARQLRREWESPELWPRIQAALAAEAARIERRRAPSRVSAWLTLAAAAAALVFGITVVLRGRAKSEDSERKRNDRDESERFHLRDSVAART